MISSSGRCCRWTIASRHLSAASLFQAKSVYFFPPQKRSIYSPLSVARNNTQSWHVTLRWLLTVRLLSLTQQKRDTGFVCERVFAGQGVSLVWDTEL